MPDDSKRTVAPRLRFPEFRKSAEWKRAPLSSVLTEKGLTSDGKAEVHSVSLAKGVVPQVEHMGRSFSAADTSHYTLVRPFDLIYTKSPLAIFKLGIVKQHRGPQNALVSPLYGVFSPRNRHIGQMIEAYFDSPSRSMRFLEPLCQKGAKNTIQISNDRFLSGEMALPEDEAEQQKIAACLTSLDEVIAAQSRKVEALNAYKRGLLQQLFPREGETLPRVRFPAFNGAGDWEPFAVGKLVNTITPPKKLQTTSYLPRGLYPIVDQSPAQWCGWTDDVDAIISPNKPFIVFGDHTCTLKILRNPFAQGADGIKILDPQAAVVSDFLFQALQVRPLVSNEYKRHFSDLKVKKVAVPHRETGEQQRIAGTLRALDEFVATQAKKLAVLKAHKKGLILQLFPSPEGV